MKIPKNRSIIKPNSNDFTSLAFTPKEEVFLSLYSFRNGIISIFIFIFSTYYAYQQTKIAIHHLVHITNLLDNTKNNTHITFSEKKRGG